MSIPRRESIPCPGCGKPLEFTLWESINTQIKTALPDIISGELFRVRCEHCGEDTRLDYPILFNDMEHNVMLWYLSDYDPPKEQLESLCIFGQSRLRQVPSQARLQEKAAIFNAGLDDRVVEVMKLVAVSAILEEREAQGDPNQLLPEEVYFYVLPDGGHYLQLVKGKQEIYGEEYEPDYYAEIEREMKPSLPDDYQPLKVDADWALQWISTHDPAEE